MMRVAVDFDLFDVHFSPSSFTLPPSTTSSWMMLVGMLEFPYHVCGLESTDELAFLDWSVFCRLSLI